MADNKQPKIGRIYFEHSFCEGCGDEDYFNCQECVRNAGYELYQDFRKVAPKADKVVVVARNSDWRGRTGYLVLNFERGMMEELLGKTQSFHVSVYRELKSFKVRAYSHDVPQGGTWLLVPIISRGRHNDALIQEVQGKLAKAVK